MWPSNTVNLKLFAELRDVTLIFENSNEPWDHYDTTWRQLWADLTSAQKRREDMLLNTLSKLVDFVEIREQHWANRLLQRLGRARYCTAAYRNLMVAKLHYLIQSFRHDIAHEYFERRVKEKIKRLSLNR